MPNRIQSNQNIEKHAPPLLWRAQLFHNKASSDSTHTMSVLGESRAFCQRSIHRGNAQTQYNSSASTYELPSQRSSFVGNSPCDSYPPHRASPMPSCGFLAESRASAGLYATAVSAHNIYIAAAVLICFANVLDEHYCRSGRTYCTINSVGCKNYEMSQIST